MSDGTILLLGATSDIGGEVAARLCAGRDVVAAMRDVAVQGVVEKQLLDAGARSVRVVEFEATDLASHRELVESVEGLTTAIVAFGILGDQELAERDEAEAVRIAEVDYLAQVSMLTVLALSLIHI